MPPPKFSLMAAAFEGGLAVVAIALGWLLGRPPLASLVLDPSALLLGVVAVLPPLVLLAMCQWLPFAPFSEVRGAVDELVIPLFKNCNVVEMAVISVLAGLGEEMLFRGVFQASLADWGGRLLGAAAIAGLGQQSAAWGAAVVVAVLFGLMHFVNAGYALLAMLIGLYLGGLWILTGNLMVPATAHALYDFLALLYLLRVRAPPAPTGVS
jgi:uncharacterized protein